MAKLFSQPNTYLPCKFYSIFCFFLIHFWQDSPLLIPCWENYKFSCCEYYWLFYLFFGLGEFFLNDVFNLLIEKYIFELMSASTENGRIPNIKRKLIERLFVFLQNFVCNIGNTLYLLKKSKSTSESRLYNFYWVWGVWVYGIYWNE